MKYMKIYTVSYKDSESVKLRIPETAQEIRAVDMVKFQDAKKASTEFFHETSDNLKTLITDAEYLQYASEVFIIIQKTFAVDLSNSIKLDDVDINTSINTILAIYVQVNNIISNYEPKERKTFSHKGIKYHIVTSVIDAFTSEEINPPLTFGEFLLLSQAKSNYSNYVENNTSFYYMMLTMLAVLARKNENETLPLTQLEIEVFTKERAKEFQDVSIDVLFDLWFFFALT